MIQIDIADLDGAMFTWFYADILQIKEYLTQMEDAVIRPDADLGHVLKLEYAYNPNPQKAVFYAVDSSNCVMFSNMQDGWNSLVYNIVDLINCEAFFVQFMDEKKLLNPGNYFQYFSKGARRTVYAIKENRWVFYEEGPPRDFECTEYYRRAIKKKRLNKDIILEYCTKAGIIKNGVMTVNEDLCFTFELFWRGELSGCPGKGPGALQRK